MEKYYTINELADEWLSEHLDDIISPNIIRFYIRQGLMIAPGRKGKGKHYREIHLQQITLIRLMQRNGMINDEIRGLLWDLNSEELEQAIKEQKNIMEYRIKEIEHLRNKLK